jgi:hypothetical protein
VKIEGLGTFYTTLECKKGGAVSKDKFNVLKDIKGLHIRFLPEQEQEQNISSRQFLKQAEFINIDSLLPKEEEAEGGNGGGNSGGSENGGSQSGEQGGNGGSQNGGSQSEQGGSQSGQQGEQNQSSGFALTISKSGTGTASVTSGGNAVNSGDSLSEDAEVEISITPAEGKVPTASVNGSSIELTESEGVYEGSFAMPGQASSLVIETGTAEGGDSGDGIDKD